MTTTSDAKTAAKEDKTAAKDQLDEIRILVGILKNQALEAQKVATVEDRYALGDAFQGLVEIERDLGHAIALRQ